LLQKNHYIENTKEQNRGTDSQNSNNSNALIKAGYTALESITGPFDDVKGIHDNIAKSLKPLGLKLDTAG
jgi:hypothetical protein